MACGQEDVAQLNHHKKQTKAHRHTKYKIEGNDHFRTQIQGI